MARDGDVPPRIVVSISTVATVVVDASSHVVYASAPVEPVAARVVVEKIVVVVAKEPVVVQAAA